MGALLDGLTLGAIYAAFVSVLSLQYGATDFQSIVNDAFAFSFLLAPLAYFLFITIWFFYGTITDVLGRPTVGRYVMGMATVSRDNKRLPAVRALAKNLLIYAGALTFGLSWVAFIIIRGRPLSESLTGTFVVDKRE